PIAPPDWPALAERHLGLLHAPSSPRIERLVPSAPRPPHVPARPHELAHQARPLRFYERWVGASPEPTTHDEVASVGGHRIGRRAARHEGRYSPPTQPRPCWGRTLTARASARTRSRTAGERIARATSQPHRRAGSRRRD